MFAIIEESGHQIRVEEGQVLAIDYRDGAEVGQTLTFDKVLLANGGGTSQIGRPVLEGATVEAEVIEDLVKGPKLEVQKFRRRKNSRRHTGHRQKYTGVKITAINVPNLEIVEQQEEAAPAEEATAEA
ncbi:MAG: 50S ribosomal protein L21 [Planctomycetaceae bacterium]|nr:50S ribosomal protein L21 [Planctomycetaceae bacterium]